MRKDNTLSIPRHDVRQFTWSNRTGSAEASALGTQTWGRIYKDACDVGFVVYNPWTENEHLYHMTENVLDLSNEIGGWMFESDTIKAPITIWND